MDFVIRSTAKAVREHGLNCESKTFLDLDYADDFSILDEGVCKRNELLEVSQVQGARICLNIDH